MQQVEADLHSSHCHCQTPLMMRMLKKITEEIIDEGRKLDSKKNEYQLTKSLIDNLEGYPESLRFLKKSGNCCQPGLAAL